uniref:Acidic mammalian chitinase n=1 Tax=Cacopsylla melanoneura TaxID=428564 RepID=A0A8D8YK73_9HEMI
MFSSTDAGIVIYLLVSVFQLHPIAANEDCWWTGCQPDDWAVKGCSQYNRTEQNREHCENGLKYECCLPCKWTGCERNDWAKKGCEHLGMAESRREACEEGNRYLCCPRDGVGANDCWWTSCQEDNWAVTGCEQYERREASKVECPAADAGSKSHKYQCCPRGISPSGVIPSGYPQCLWSPCQPFNQTDRGCPPDSKQIGKEVCPYGEQGEIFRCCFKVERNEELDNTEESSGESFVDFVKYLLFRGRNFTIQPDLLPCTMMDPDKVALLQVQNEGLRICDLCPSFPQKRLTNILIDTQPMRTEYNKVFGECYEICFNEDSCMAFSYDHGSSDCYMFDSTVATLRSEGGWTSVFMTQPTGILGDWSYVRHTAVTGTTSTRTSEKDFLTCLAKCENSPTCNIVSYSLIGKTCDLFKSDSDLQYVDLKYGFISAFNVRQFPLGSDQLWRFIEEGDILEATKNINEKDECVKKHYNGSFSAYYSKPCLTNQLSGCDPTNGCKHCYYPEIVNQEIDLPICPDSESNRKEDIVKQIDREMNNCLKNDKCVGVGYDKSKNTYEQITVQTLGKQYEASYMLTYPKLNSGIHRYLDKVELLSNVRISPIKDSKSNYQRLTGISSFEDCLKKLKENQAFSKASYSITKNECHLGDTKIEFKTENDMITMFEKPNIISHLKNFIRVPNANVEISKALSKYDGCQNHCEEECAKKCEGICAYVLVKYLADKTECFFFEDKDDLKLSLSGNTLALVKTSALNFTLESLNQLTPFQRQHIFDCFSDNNEQTQSSLSTYDINSQTSTARKKRGIFSAIGKAFKKVGQFIGNAVKDTVKTVVDNVKGVVKSVGKVIKGDLKGAKKEFLNIPVVKDVKNVVELGKAVVTGDWDKAKEKGIDLLQSGTLDLVTTVIPGGKLIGTAAKAAGKGLKAASAAGKKAGDKIKRSVDKGVEKVEHKNKKVKDDKKKEDTNNVEDRGNCKRRPKRAATNSKKRKKPCDDDDDDDEKYCLKPNFANILYESVEDCVKKEAGERCDYECEPGYREEDPRIVCKKVNKKHVWPQDGRCELQTCDPGLFPNYPLITLETPQLSQYYRPGFGKYITAYMILFSKRDKLPVWSIAMQQADFSGNKFGLAKFKSKSYNTVKASERNPAFVRYPCTLLNGHQGTDPDYTNTGWDRGHLTPANIARWSPKAKKLINLFINIAPQDPKTNSDAWRHLERHVECNSDYHPSLVATGICLDGVTQRSKPGGLLVPKCYWKLVCYKDEKGVEQVVGFISDNTHVTKGPTNTNRKRQVFTPVSQDDVKRVMTSGGHPSIKDPWTLTATQIYKGREVAVAGAGAASSSSVWFPVNAIKCASVDKLDDTEKLAWEEAFGRKKRPASAIKKTPKPDPLAPTKVLRGCYNKDDPLFDDPDFDDESSDSDDSDIDMSDASQAALAVNKEKADGVSLVGNVAKCNKRIIGYYTSWGKKTISAAHLKRITHVIYAFIEMNADGTVDIGSADRATSTDPEKDKQITLERLTYLLNLASKFPHLKVMFAVGGWANSQYFSGMAASPDKRIRFIASVIKLIEKFGFDGVDIDWEYPVTGGANEGVPADKQNYVTFMKELRTALDELASKVNRAEKFLISFASAAGQWTLDPGYDLPGLLKYADFANVMTYDFFGAWESKWGAYTGPPAPLFFGMPPRFSGKTNVDWTMKYYACKSKTPHKINMGVPFYGRYWKNVGDPVDKSDGMWRMSNAVNGKFEGGYVPWNEIESQYLKNGFEKHFHQKAKAPYAWSASTKTFLGYEDVQSLTNKKNYAAEKNIGGLMIWALELDDDNVSLLDVVASASLCDKTDPNLVNYKCSPIDEKRWWTSEDGDDKAGLCGRSAPLYKGYYPVCDPDDPGYSCCGEFGYCGTGDKYCKCPSCTDYQNNPEKITKGPTKPSVPVRWYFLNDPDGKRGRCGKTIPKINGEYPICNPDDDNAYCCSNGGYCGNSPGHCDCPDCVNFRKNPNHKF